MLVGLAMAEICSAHPTSGGPYFWHVNPLNFRLSITKQGMQGCDDGPAGKGRPGKLGDGLVQSPWSGRSHHWYKVNTIPLSYQAILTKSTVMRVPTLYPLLRRWVRLLNRVPILRSEYMQGFS